MNVQRRLHCTFILFPDVPRGRETVGTTPPPRPAPQKECATTPQPRPPYHQQASLWPATVVLGRIPRRAPTPAPPVGVATPATGPRPTRTARHTAEHFVQKVTDCAQSDLDSSLSTRNVTLCTKRPRTPLPPTQPGTLGVGPLAHVEDGSHPHNQEPRPPQTEPAPPTPLSGTSDQPHRTHTQPDPPPHPHHKHHPHEQVPFSRQTSTVLTSNKYRSHEQ